MCNDFTNIDTQHNCFVIYKLQDGFMLRLFRETKIYEEKLTIEHVKRNNLASLDELNKVLTGFVNNNYVYEILDDSNDINKIKINIECCLRSPKTSGIKFFSENEISNEQLNKELKSQVSFEMHNKENEIINHIKELEVKNSDLKSSMIKTKEDFIAKYTAMQESIKKLTDENKLLIDKVEKLSHIESRCNKLEELINKINSDKNIEMFHYNTDKTIIFGKIDDLEKKKSETTNAIGKLTMIENETNKKIDRVEKQISSMQMRLPPVD